MIKRKKIMAETKEERDVILAILLFFGYRWCGSQWTVEEMERNIPFRTSSYERHLCVDGGPSICYGADGLEQMTIAEFIKEHCKHKSVQMVTNGYIATVSDKVSIGCQTFDRAPILALADEILKRRAP